MKGSGRGAQHQQQPALGEEGDFAVHASVYGKVQAKTDVNLTTKREEKGEKDACWLPKLGWLATYAGYVPLCALLSVPGGDIHPTTVYSHS